MKLTSCSASSYGLCASTEADPSTVLGKYLPNDLFLVGDSCITCPSGWSALNGKCFKFFNGPLTQANAQNDCRSKNATLANAITNDIFNLIKSLIGTSSPYVNI